MSAFMDALRSCTGLSGPYSCSNGPLRSSSLRAEKAGRPSGRPVVEGERALPWTRRAFIHMTRAIKEHRSRCFSLSVSSAFSCMPPLTPPSVFSPTFSPPQTEKRGLIVCCESQRLQSLPSFFLLCLFLLFFKPPTPFLKNVILSERQGKKSIGIFLRNVDVKEPKHSDTGSESEGAERRLFLFTFFFVCFRSYFFLCLKVITKYCTFKSTVPFCCLTLPN